MAAAMSLAYTATPLPAGAKMCIYATRQLSAGINFAPRGAYKLIMVTAAAAASPANILAAYTAKFGSLVVGNKVLIRGVVISATGIASPFFDTSIVIA